MLTNNPSDWKHTKTNIFWGEVAPCEHVLQIYETDEVFIDVLAGFVGDGINSNDACIVIATPEHLRDLETRLKSCGISISGLLGDNRYIPLDAEVLLSSFMVNGWPDEGKFNKAVTSLLEKARGLGNRKIRAFGEMVAILWAQGYIGATVNLEHLWNKFAAKESFSLFCAYPRTGFTNNPADSIQHICSAHSKMIDGAVKQVTEILYKETVYQNAS